MMLLRWQSLLCLAVGSLCSDLPDNQFQTLSYGSIVEQLLDLAANYPHLVEVRCVITPPDHGLVPGIRNELTTLLPCLVDIVYTEKEIRRANRIMGSTAVSGSSPQDEYSYSPQPAVETRKG